MGDEDGRAEVKTLDNLKTWNFISYISCFTCDEQKKGIVYCDDPERIKFKFYQQLENLGIGDVLGFESELIETGT